MPGELPPVIPEDSVPDTPPAPASRLSLNLGAMAAGEFQPAQGEGFDFLTTARAQNEVAITVRGDSKMKARRIMHLQPTMLGKGKVKAAWRPNSTQLAVAAEKDDHTLLYLFARSTMPKPSEVHNLGPGKPVWLDWDCQGSSLALMQEGVGLYLWDLPKESGGAAPTQPLRLAPTITVDTTFCMWSRKYLQLAIGTKAGKVIIFNKPQQMMQLHERKGKHGAPVTCGDWLTDNRLGLASGTRVKISKPLPEEGAQWESYSKFKLSGMLSRVPRKFKDAGEPKLLSFSLTYPPFVAVCIGENYMLVFGTTGSHNNEDVGLTFPEDYGPITGFQWLEDDVVLVSLANGYVTSVDFGAMVRMRRQHGLPEAVKATGTTKVFNEYLTCLTYSPKSKRIAAVGDKGVKVIVRDGGDLEVLVDHTLEYELTIGHCIDSCKWDDKGNALLITAVSARPHAHARARTRTHAHARARTRTHAHARSHIHTNTRTLTLTRTRTHYAHARTMHTHAPYAHARTIALPHPFVSLDSHTRPPPHGTPQTNGHCWCFDFSSK
jgi:hypothetical protein